MLSTTSGTETPSRPGLFWHLAMMFIMAIYAGALTPAVRNYSGAGSLSAGDSDIGSTAMQFCSLAIVLFWGMRNPGRLSGMLKPVLPYLAILAFCFASFLWSDYKFNSLRRSLSLSVCIFYGLYLHDRIGLDGMLRMFVRAAVGLALLSIVVYFIVPSVGHDTAEGYGDALRGVFASKNQAGMAMVLAIANLLYLGSRPRANRAGVIAGTVVTFGMLFMTKSASSLVIALILLGIGSRLWLRSPAARLTHSAIVAALLLIALFSVVFWPEAIFSAAGRDANLTGRVPLWQELFRFAQARWLLGYGYNGFWNADSRNVQFVWQMVGWKAPNGHNGYLDIVLQIGVVGLLLYMVAWSKILAGAIRQLLQGTLPEAQWIALFMLVNVLLNVDEGPLPYPDQFTLFSGVCLVVLARAPARALMTRPRMFGPARRGTPWREGPA